VPSAGWHHVFTAWERHDALWFLRIAADGYRADDGSGAFFPLYPLLTRAVGTALGGHWLLGAYVVSNVALVVALTVLYRLTERELSDLAARRTVLYLAVFPTAFFLYAPYTESLFLALVLGSLYAARRSAWLLAGGLGALAALTRSTGLLLVLPLVVEAALQAREVPGPGRTRRLAVRWRPPGLVPVGTAAYLLYWQRTRGTRCARWSCRARSGAARAPGRGRRCWPGPGRGSLLRQLPRRLPHGRPGVVLVAVLAGGWVVLRMRATYAVWVAVSLLLPLTLAFDGGRCCPCRASSWWSSRCSGRWPGWPSAGGCTTRWWPPRPRDSACCRCCFVNWYYIF
jgi:hypothetical protein